jgi:hypothetical protein
MRSGYTCCLANMHQGWTKFTTHLWYVAGEHGLAALEYAPCSVTSVVGKHNTPVTIRETTDYPFDDHIVLDITCHESTEFPLQLRIPGWCKGAEIMINEEEVHRAAGGQVFTLDRLWQNGDQVSIRFPMKVRVSEWGRNSRAVERGPLVYALRLDERWEKGKDEKEGDYWCVYPEEPWNYGLLENVVRNPATRIIVKQRIPVSSGFIWNIAHAPIELITQAKKIPGWILDNDVAPLPVTDRDGAFRGIVSDSTETITLIPYGCTKVRIVAFPVVP